MLETVEVGDYALDLDISISDANISVYDGFDITFTMQNNENDTIPDIFISSNYNDELIEIVEGDNEAAVAEAGMGYRVHGSCCGRRC